MNHIFRGNGKLLLTGEYFVLDGVAGLAVPTQLGQTLSLTENDGDYLQWNAYAATGTKWFDGHFLREDWDAQLTQKKARPQVQGAVPNKRQSEDVGARICQLLSAAEELRPGCTHQLSGKIITTRLEFDRHWGLGSSSTLVACLAQLLAVSPYALLDRTFGGSGYDLACAVNNTPILYERTGPKVTPINWRPDWVNNTVFVYRNQKQNSREGIRAYRKASVSEQHRKDIHDLSIALSSPTVDLRTAAQILQQHERIVAEVIGQAPIQEALFPEFPGQLKSLGAWGGDFFWAISEIGQEKMGEYFNERGFTTVVSYEEMVLV